LGRPPVGDARELDLVEDGEHPIGDERLVVAFDPQPERDVVETMTSAVDLGLELFVVSDPKHLSSRIDATLLPVTISTGALFDSHAAVTVMIAALIDAIGDEDRSASQARLEAVDGRTVRRRWVG